MPADRRTTRALLVRARATALHGEDVSVDNELCPGMEPRNELASWAFDAIREQGFSDCAVAHEIIASALLDGLSVGLLTKVGG
ncbi:MAG TPA: hypothetical protein VHG72_21635 [Polyangia bacterium]|nr:hypothetical protein [Polyangia bacterium]